MKIRSTFLLAFAAFAAAPAGAQDAATSERPPVKTDVSAVVPAEYAGNPEWMLALDLSTGGRVVIQLRPDVAPIHAARLKELARAGFYNGVVFHRVIDGFMAQTGDPTGTGQGDSDLPDMNAELSVLPHLRGTVSMARAGRFDSANSQFFIMFQPRFSLDRNYSVFGRVVSGMEYIDAIRRGEPPALPSRVVQASVLADNLPVPPASMLVETQRPAAPSTDDAISVDDLNASQ